MGIINRRNAVFGWSVWQVVKRMGKKKAREAVPGTGDHAGLNKSAIATIIAAIGGALFFWRKKSDGQTTTSS
jgi:ABC-type Co2+ transport system permease subunit